MKKIPRKPLSLLLLTLFAVGLLAAPASADEVVGEVEPPAPGDEVSEEVEVPAYIEDLLNDSAESFLAEVMGSGLVIVDELTCSHTKTIIPQTSCIPNGDSGHYRNETRYLLCRDCNKAKELSSTSFSEAHSYYANSKYIGSNHTGPYSSHTYSYGYTCAACGYVKIETVPAGCTASGCVDPQSLEPPIETCSDDMIFGIYLD